MDNRVVATLKHVDEAGSLANLVEGLFPLLDLSETELDYFNRAYSLARRNGLISSEERDSLHSTASEWSAQSPARRFALFILFIRFFAITLDSDAKEISAVIGRSK